jgi:hypothetical protein
MVALRRIALLGALFGAFLLGALPAFGQSGIRLPERGELGLDPSFARGWFAPEYDRFGFAANHWRPRGQWSYSFNDRSNVGMSLFNNGRESEFEQRPMSVFGRYWFSPDWAVSAESLSRDPTGLFRLQDFRIGVQRRF